LRRVVLRNRNAKRVLQSLVKTIQFRAVIIPGAPAGSRRKGVRDVFSMQLDALFQCYWHTVGFQLFINTNNLDDS
jgi:hypothetical protein